MKWWTTCGVGAAMTAAVLVGMSVANAKSPAPESAQTITFADLISGSWEGYASSEVFPEDLPLWVMLDMDEDGDVVGTFSTPDGDAPFEGFFDAEENLLTGAVTPEDANWELSLTLDGDELEGEATETNSGTKAKVVLNRSDE